MTFFLKFGIALSTFFMFPLNVKADFGLLDSAPSYDPFTSSNSINSGINKYRTFDDNWGNIDQEAEIDLSEWGGKAPTCEEAPGCPVCIK